MKVGKYPVKRSYKIARLVSDVISAGLAVLICSVEYMFMTVYDETLKSYIGEENLQKLAQTDPSIEWKQWITLVFPAAVLAVFAVYVILVVTSRKLPWLNITKKTAQAVYDNYAFCASLCKIPALMFINEMMMITHNKMLMSDESWFTIQLVLDLMIIVLLILVFRKRLVKITSSEESSAAGASISVSAARDEVESEETKNTERN